MKKLILAGMTVAAGLAFAAPTAAPKGAKNPPPGAINIKDLTKAERKQLFLEYEGGKIEKPGSAKGKFVFVNAQKTADMKWLDEAVSNVNEKIHFVTEIKDGAFTFPSPKLEGEATMFVIDDPAMPSLLHAPENRWVMVNVAGLKAGEGAKPQFFEARCRKEFTRAFCLLAGTQDSNYPKSLLGCKTKPEDLDWHSDSRLPVDIRRRLPVYAEGYGIKPRIITSYRKACREGWAPKPVNQLQQDVWDDVHKLPTKPIKVEFDPKKGE